MTCSRCGTVKVFYYVFGVFFFILIFYVLINYLPGGENKIISQQPDVSLPSAYVGEKIIPFLLNESDIQIQNGKIMFDYYKLKDKKFVEFIYRSNVSTVKLIAFITPSGKMVTSIGLCEPCGQENFEILERELISSCGTKWYLNNLEFSGGCPVCKKFPPDPIPSLIDENNKIVIDENIVKTWKRRAY